MNRNDLAAQSTMMKDMLSFPNDGSSEVTIAESKELLDLFLPYCGQGRVPLLDLDGPHAWTLIKTFDKYDVSSLWE